MQTTVIMRSVNPTLLMTIMSLRSSDNWRSVRLLPDRGGSDDDESEEDAERGTPSPIWVLGFLRLMHKGVDGGCD